MDLKKAYQEKTEAQIKEWDAKVDQLKAKALLAKAEAKIRTEEQINSLLEKREVTSQKLQALKEIGEDKWEGLKEGIEQGWHDMKKSLEEILDKNK